MENQLEDRQGCLTMDVHCTGQTSCPPRLGSLPPDSFPRPHSCSLRSYYQIPGQPLDAKMGVLEGEAGRVCAMLM